MAFQTLVFAALISLSLAQLEIPGTLVVRPSSQSFASYAFTPTCDGSSVYSACKSCNTVLVCLGETNDEKDCSVASPETPFCVNGACSATPDPEEKCYAASMACTGEGFYPDPKNCQMYHHCEGVDQESSVYECAPNYVVNSATGLCKPKVYPSDCVSVKCSKDQVFASYGTSKTFFAYCEYEGDAVKNIRMMKCPPYSAFNGVTCVFTCPKVGYFQHSDPAKFYNCYLSGGRYIYQVQTCTSGKIFNQDRQVCLTAPTTDAPEPAP